MRFLIILLLCTFVACQIDYEKKIRDFFTKHGKIILDPSKLLKARELLKKAIDRVEAHNKAFLSGAAPYQMDLYDFSDEDPIEVVNQKCKTQVPRTARALRQTAQSLSSFPAGPISKDWRSELLPIVDQEVTINQLTNKNYL
jgi:hypothetical protein